MPYTRLGAFDLVERPIAGGVESALCCGQPHGEHPPHHKYHDNPTGLGGVAQADLAFVNATPINTNAYMSFMEILNVRSCDTGWARRASERCR